MQVVAGAQSQQVALVGQSRRESSGDGGRRGLGREALPQPGARRPKASVCRQSLTYFGVERRGGAVEGRMGFPITTAGMRESARGSWCIRAVGYTRRRRGRGRDVLTGRGRVLMCGASDASGFCLKAASARMAQFHPHGCRMGAASLALRNASSNSRHAKPRPGTVSWLTWRMWTISSAAVSGFPSRYTPAKRKNANTTSESQILSWVHGRRGEGGHQ